MNQLCKVCGEPAAGFHFGAFTCEGCKSFFGRTYNNISAIAGCKNNGDCVINKKNRTACKACRLRKCLLVGMSKSGSRYGRRSNWFKIHCLLQEQQNQSGASGTDAGGVGGGGGGGGTNGNSFEQLARLHQMHAARQTYQDKTNPCIKSASMSPTLSIPALSQRMNATAPPNLLCANKFLNGVDGGGLNRIPTSFKSESRLSSKTPSDSGASSAGEPVDDCTSNTSDRRQRNCSSANAVQQQQQDFGRGVMIGDEADDEHELRRKQFLEIFRSHSDPLRTPFMPFNVASMLSAPAVAPSVQLLPTVKAEREVSRSPAIATSAVDISGQEEPIDLSIKSQRSSRRSLSPQRSSRSLSPPAEDEVEEIEVDVKPKTTPLDLTLMRPQYLTG